MKKSLLNQRKLHSQSQWKWRGRNWWSRWWCWCHKFIQCKKRLKIKYYDFLSHFTFFFLKIIRVQKRAHASFSSAAFLWKILKSVFIFNTDVALLSMRTAKILLGSHKEYLCKCKPIDVSNIGAHYSSCKHFFRNNKTINLLIRGG